MNTRVRRQLLLFASVTVAASSAIASTTICELTDKLRPIQLISWDTESLQAKMQFVKDTASHPGQLTLIRPQDDAKKVNLYFSPKDRTLADEIELAVGPSDLPPSPAGFPAKPAFKVIMAGYRLVDGKRHLHGGGTYYAKCNTL